MVIAAHFYLKEAKWPCPTTKMPQFQSMQEEGSGEPTMVPTLPKETHFPRNLIGPGMLSFPKITLNARNLFLHTCAPLYYCAGSLPGREVLL